MKSHIIKNGIVVNTIMATVAEVQAVYPDATCIEATGGGIGWLWDGVVLHPPAAAPVSIDDLCNEIDRAADAARLLIVGDPVRVVEYQRAETEATAYAAAGYTGTVPPSVLSWAEAKDWTAQAAADDILRASAAWNAALYALRDIRLKGKEAVKSAETAADAQAAAATAEAQIKAVLAQVQ